MAPVLSAGGYGLTAFGILLFFSPVCHQDPARLFWIFGGPVAVCARCLGIYLGAAVGAWIPAPRRVLLAGLALFAALNLADVLTEAAAWHGNWKLTRLILGALLGLAAGSLVANSMKRDVFSASVTVR
ncbi:MAG TPA: DUF2085 domain-containing protein [Terriglobales bacterium]|nr:DUF2085 domain-containing protein [Terriglobales bacterium]